MGKPAGYLAKLFRVSGVRTMVAVSANIRLGDLPELI